MALAGEHDHIDLSISTLTVGSRSFRSLDAVFSVYNSKVLYYHRLRNWQNEIVGMQFYERDHTCNSKLRSDTAELYNSGVLLIKIQHPKVSEFQEGNVPIEKQIHLVVLRGLFPLVVLNVVMERESISTLVKKHIGFHKLLLIGPIICHLGFPNLLRFHWRISPCSVTIFLHAFYINMRLAMPNMHETINNM